MAQKKESPHKNNNWQGYTIDELRYQRALTSARLEIQKERLLNSFDTMRGTFGTMQPTGIVGKMLKSLSLIDYGIIAFRLFNRVSAITRSFRRH